MPTILVAEDDQMNRTILERFLVRRGFDVVLAGDGQEAIALTERVAPSLILMDMSMPVLDGWTATSRIKSDPQLTAIPIIAVTAYSLAGERERALAAGCDDYLTKPIDLRALFELMSRYLPQLPTPPASRTV